jgi:hypothetical protein
VSRPSTQRRLKDEADNAAINSKGVQNKARLPARPELTESVLSRELARFLSQRPSNRHVSLAA